MVSWRPVRRTRATGTRRPNTESHRRHIWIPSFPRSRGTFPSRDRTQPRRRSHMSGRSRVRRCPGRTLTEGEETEGGDVLSNEAKRQRPRRHVRVTSADLTDLGGSGPRGTPEDTGTGLTRGDRRLRWRSRTAAGTAGRGDQEGRLREERMGERATTALRNDPRRGRDPICQRSPASNVTRDSNHWIHSVLWCWN